MTKKHQLQIENMMNGAHGNRKNSEIGSGSDVTASGLIVVSNRLPFVLKRHEDDETVLIRKASAGGLVTAVAPVVVQSGGKTSAKSNI